MKIWASDSSIDFFLLSLFCYLKYFLMKKKTFQNIFVAYNKVTLYNVNNSAELDR